MSSLLDVLFTPADFAPLPQHDLRQTVCVVFDVLRATSSMVTAFANGAEAIKPVGEIHQALAIRQQNPQVLLAGERHGLRIQAAQTGGIDFDLGNSPREFTAQKVAGRSIVMTTTNGTRALQSCAQAQTVWVGAFLNLPALTSRLSQNPPKRLLVICGGTFEEAALEDTLAAGAICEALWPLYQQSHITDSATMAKLLYRQCQADWPTAVKQARNARQLLSRPDLRDDFQFSLRIGVSDVLPALQRDGWIRNGR